MKSWVRILFRRFQLRDYARFDFRVGSDNTPKLMEVNPNPAWAYDGKLAFMAGFAGINMETCYTRFFTRRSPGCQSQPVREATVESPVPNQVF